MVEVTLKHEMEGFQAAVSHFDAMEGWGCWEGLETVSKVTEM